jgi:predicted ATP-dependent protease
MVMGPAGPIQIEAADRYRHYRVNLLIERSRDQGAPIVYEDHPSHQNLLGRIEHLSQFGTLSTDFSLIKPGALHRANGGYLFLDARRVMMQPFAWEELKRALRAQHIRIESLAQSLSLISTVTLEPGPVPLDVKVVLIGDRILYYLLCALDPDFAELFKVPVDFSEDVDWSDGNALLLARMLGATAQENKLHPLDRGTVARVIEHASRLADDAVKQRRVRWSFTTAHGQIEDQIKAIGRVMQLEASARRLAKLAGGSLLMIHPAQRLAGPVHAIIEAASAQ